MSLWGRDKCLNAWSLHGGRAKGLRFNRAGYTPSDVSMAYITRQLVRTRSRTT